MYTEQVVNFLMGYVGRIPYAILSLGFLFAGPVVLLVVFVRVLVAAQGRTAPGVYLGVGAAAWASICWLTVPYLGAYPCLPALIVKGVLFKWGPIETAAEELTLHMANFVIWPLVGWSTIRAQRIVMRHAHHSGGSNAAPPVRPA